jgi:hypothetical protein
MKTFTIMTAEGPKKVEQVGTFVEYINNVQFRFVMTREAPSLPIAVTHRISGKRVCEVTNSQLMASLGDVVGAGKLAIHGLIQSKTADRVYAILRAAEKVAV